MRVLTANPNLTFRTMRMSDQPELAALWVDSWTEVFPAINFEERRNWFVNHLERWTAEGKLCQVAHDAKIASICGFFMLDPRTGHVDQFCIGPSHKGSGTAQALMARLRELSPRGLHLDVNAQNHRAIRFYEREGFVKTGEGINPLSGLPIFTYRWQP
jgi:putative acetyltransferase